MKQSSSPVGKDQGGLDQIYRWLLRFGGLNWCFSPSDQTFEQVIQAFKVDATFQCIVTLWPSYFLEATLGSSGLVFLHWINFECLNHVQVFLTVNKKCWTFSNAHKKVKLTVKFSYRKLFPSFWINSFQSRNRDLLWTKVEFWSEPFALELYFPNV